jgi:uncharacterized protein YjiS (DUF1127 family)
MRKATDLDSLATPEEATPRDAIKYGDTPIVIVQRAPACNDATCEDPPISKEDLEPWSQHALAANGFGDVTTTDTAWSARPSSYALHQAALAHRSFTLGEIIVEAIRAVGAIVGAIASRALARYRQRRQARAIYDALRQLDDRTLHDLGFDRSELRSVVAEVTGKAERTRVRAIALAETPDRHAPSAVRPHQNALPTSY